MRLKLQPGIFILWNDRGLDVLWIGEILFVKGIPRAHDNLQGGEDKCEKKRN